MNSVLDNAAPLLSQEGWPEGPGWFPRGILQECGFGTTPRVIACGYHAALLTQEGSSPYSTKSVHSYRHSLCIEIGE
jgi:hypothetical protein